MTNDEALRLIEKHRLRLSYIPNDVYPPYRITFLTGNQNTDIFVKEHTLPAAVLLLAHSLHSRRLIPSGTIAAIDSSPVLTKMVRNFVIDALPDLDEDISR